MKQSTLGSFLRQLRHLRGLSQEQAARAARLGRVTLSRWESGAQQPRHIDLESLLSALNASPEERRQLLSLLDRIQTRNRMRASLEKAEGELVPLKDVGPLPNSGDLLRVLRMRRGLSQEATAQLVEVTERTLRRWEKSEVWPSGEQIQRLCSVLEAHPVEAAALAQGPFLSPPDDGPLSLEEIRSRGHQLCFYAENGTKNFLKELGFLKLESMVWPHAKRSLEGQRVLAQIYGYHAHHLSCLERFAESGVYAHLALDLWPEERPYPIHLVMGIALARAAAYNGARPAPAKGLEVLRHWVEVAHPPGYKAWILSDMAKYLVQDGKKAEGLSLAKRASRVAMDCDNPLELYNRQLDEVQVMIWADKPHQALETLALVEQKQDKHSAKVKLLETEAYLGQNQVSRAYEKLMKAWQIIDRDALWELMPQAQKLSFRF